ncbi:hypothetical protein [Paenibacillus sp. R14(2021)]|nr:hypothetical protein [Paenibacillus sp. R14(2021)]
MFAAGVCRLHPAQAHTGAAAAGAWPPGCMVCSMPLGRMGA